MSVQTDPALREHPNRVDWNARYERAGSAHAPFAPVPWLADVLRAGVPDGPVLELASGRSGTALALAAHGRQVTAIDVSDVALLQLDSEAVRRGVADRLRPTWAAGNPARRVSRWCSAGSFGMRRYFTAPVRR